MTNNQSRRDAANDNSLTLKQAGENSTSFSTKSFETVSCTRFSPGWF